jgi:hypothetical protein
MLQQGVDEVSEDEDEWELVEPITSPCDSISAFRGTEGYARKSQFKEATWCLYLRGGGSVLTQHQSHDIEMTTLVMGHQVDSAHCYKFHILQTNLLYVIF